MLDKVSVYTLIATLSTVQLTRSATVQYTAKCKVPKIGKDCDLVLGNFIKNNYYSVNSKKPINK